MAPILPFLLPCSTKQEKAENPTKKNQPLCQTFTKKNISKWPFGVKFPGWKRPPSKWENWFERMCVNHALSWEKTGICDGILSSLHDVKPNPNIVLALCEFWCPETNTFVFPWGEEATVTLEDVMILGGLPVVGEPVNAPLSPGLSKKVEILDGLCNDKALKNGKNCAWMNYFDEGKEKLLDHVGFLAFWLSRFVFPGLNGCKAVGKHVFSIAVRLDQGVKVALAPAVLASIYRSLTFLATNGADCKGSLMKEGSVSGSFQIVQLWALERFPLLGSKLARPLSLGQPRSGRWDKAMSNKSLVNVRSIIVRSASSFVWRPYGVELQNWRIKPCYIENLQFKPDCLGLDDEENKSFGVCLRPQELIGIDCVEMYRPDRVSKQLGCDQYVVGDEGVFSPVKSDDEVSLVISSVLEELEKEGADDEKPTMTSGAVEPILVCDDECSPLKRCLDDASNENDQKKRRIGSVGSGVIIDVDEEEDGHPLRSGPISKGSFGNSASNPLYINDLCSKMGRRDRKSGNLSNPIDVDDYFF